MEARGIDIMIASSMENVFYLSGALFGMLDNIRDRLAFAGMAVDGTDFTVCATNEMSTVADANHTGRLEGYVEFERTPVSALAAVLKELGYAEARIGVEKRHLMAEYYEELAGLLPKARLVGCDQALEVARAVKTPAHIDVIETASRATERAVAKAFAASRSGETEQELAMRIINNLYGEGAQTIRHAVVTVGDNAKMAHPYPSSKKLLDRGDMIRVDVGGLFDGYGTDIARMAVVGQPSNDQADRYGKVRSCVHEVGHAMRVGMTAGDVYAQACAHYARLGIPDYKRDHVGHSMSILGSHDNPLLHAGNPMPLEEGMVIALEPILRDDQGRRCTVEDVFVVGRDGSRLLTCETDTTRMAVID